MALQKKITQGKIETMKVSKVKALAKKISSGRSKTITKLKKGLTKITRKTQVKKDRVYLNSDKLFEYIQTRAYYVWQDMGQPGDQDYTIWKEAEQDIRKQFKVK